MPKVNVEESKPLDFPLKPENVKEHIKKLENAPEQPIVDGAAALKSLGN